MRITKFITLSIIFFHYTSTSLFSQTDTTYRTRQFIPRLAIHGQRGPSIETDIFFQNFYIKSSLNGRHKYFAYSSSGLYIGSEFIFFLDRPIYGPKIGAEVSVIAPTHGSAFGIEIIGYTDINKTDIGITPKIGLPLGAFNIFYAYTFFTSNNLNGQIGKHRVTLSYNLNFKGNKKLKTMHETWRQGLPKK